MARLIQHPAAAPLVAAALLSLVTLPMLGTPPLGGTEGHRVLPAQRMLDTGDWLVPELLGETYLTKPAGHFWVLAASQAVLGDHGWAWRLPSAASAVLLAAGLAWIGRRWFGPGAGWAAGVGAVALVPLWAQSRTADIEAVNTLASTATAVIVLELTVRRSSRRWAWGLALTLSFGGLLLLKLVGGLPLAVGAVFAGALVGGLRSVGRPAVWMPLVGGAAMFFAWAVPVALRLGEAGDGSGVAEASRNIVRLDRLAGALRMQGELLLFAMPLSMSLLVVPRLLTRIDVWGAANERRRMTLAILLTLAAGHAVLLLNGVTNPRYGYVVLPMWPLLAAAVAGAWRDGRLTPGDRKLAEWTLAVTAVALPVAAAALAAVQWRARPFAGFHAEPWLLAAMIAGPVVAVAALVLWGRRRIAAGTACVGVGLAVLALPMAVWLTEERFDRSGHAAALVLADTVPPGSVVIADGLARDKPELFVYARGVSVDYRRGRFARLDELEPPEGAWVGLSWKEWSRWAATPAAAALDPVAELPVRRDRPDEPAILARVVATPDAGDSPSP